MGFLNNLLGLQGMQNEVYNPFAREHGQTWLHRGGKTRTALGGIGAQCF